MFGCNCKKEIQALEERVALLEKMGVGSMKVEDALHLITAIEENPVAFGKLTVWERRFLNNVKEFSAGSVTKCITVRQSAKLQEIYRRVM